MAKEQFIGLIIVKKVNCLNQDGWHERMDLPIVRWGNLKCNGWWGQSGISGDSVSWTYSSSSVSNPCVTLGLKHALLNYKSTLSMQVQALKRCEIATRLIVLVQYVAEYSSWSAVIYVNIKQVIACLTVTSLQLGQRWLQLHLIDRAVDTIHCARMACSTTIINSVMSGNEYNKGQ